MRVLDAIRQLNDLNYPDRAASRPGDARHIFADYGYRRDEDLPWWFVRMLDDLLLRREDKFYYTDTDARLSDMGSILIELAERYGWDFDDYGEGVNLVFPASSVRVFISREAADPDTGQGCTSTEITLIP
jgi:hypothetical protein